MKRLEQDSPLRHDQSGRPLLLEPLRGRRLGRSVTILLIAVNVLVAIAMLVHGASGGIVVGSVQLAWGANFGPATKDGEWWRLGAAMFLHFGVLHLATNMFALWDSGRLVEAAFGARRFIAIYLCSGLTGNLLSLIAQGDRAVSGGASGAIFGVYGAFLVYLLHHRQRLNRSDFRWMFWGAAAFAGVMLILGSMVSGIDNAAHAGGLVAGALSGFVLLPRSRAAGSKPGVGRWLAAASYGVVTAMLIANIPAPRYRWSEEAEARGEIRAFLEEDARITARLRLILAGARAPGASFDQLAGKIEADVVKPYEQSFEQLSELQVSPTVPSALALEGVRRYAEARRNASQALAEGLRARKTQ